jgi:lipopolysaccharide export system permease protein
MVEIIPIAGLIGSIYVFAMMASQSEFTIFRVAGLDIKRSLLTLGKVSLPIVVFTLLISEVMGPYAESLSERIRMQALGSTFSSQFRSGVWVKDQLRDSDGSGPIRPGVRYVNVGTIDQNDQIRQIRMYEFDPNYRLLSIRSAASGRFDNRGIWELNDVSETRFTEKRSNDPLDAVYSAQTKVIPKLSLESQVTPQILNVLLTSPEKMSIVSLGRFILHLQDNKQDLQRHSIAFWKKLIYPFIIFVMLALALPFAFMKIRSGSVGIKVFGGIMLGMSFQLFNTLFSSIGLLGALPAFFTAIFPPLVYLVLAFLALKWVARV